MPRLSPRLLIVIGIAIWASYAAVQYTVLSLPNPDIPLLFTVSLLGLPFTVIGFIVFFLGVHRARRGRRSDVTIDIF
jgi:hypothetical protein